MTWPGQLQAAVSRIGPQGAHATDWLLFWAFVAGLAWVPYWWGSNAIFAWGVNAILFPGLVTVYELSLVVRRERHPFGIRQLWLPAALFAVVIIWILIQNATWTPFALQHPIWAMAADALEKPVRGSISVNRDLTTQALVRLVTAASVFWLAVQLCRNPIRANQFLMALVTIVTAYSVYGLVVFAIAQSGNTASPTLLRSTFINRNHFATYAGIGLIAASALIVRIYHRDFMKSAGEFRFRLAAFIDATGPKMAFLFGSAFVSFVALLLTGSRGGVIATIAGLFVMVVMTLWRHKGGSAEIRGVIGGVVLVVVATWFAFSGAIVRHFSEAELYDTERMGIVLITMRSIFDAPLLGYGYGTFMDVIPMFRDRSIIAEGTWDQAHNTYVEVFQGLGLVFGSMLIAAIILLVLKCYKGAIARRENVELPIVALSVFCLVGIQAMVDFSLQMQAIALTVMAALGAGVAQSESSRLPVSDWLENDRS